MLHCFQFSCYSFWFTIRNCDSKIDEGYMLCARRGAATLLPLIRRYVAPRTTLVSDQWAACGTIKDMPKGYQHEAVNYSLHFMHPMTGAYTKSIEPLWQKFEDWHKSRYGTERALLNSYMDEFIWNTMYGGNALYHVSSQIAEHYSRSPCSV